MNKTLLDLGLNEKEIAVYLAILELGQANVLEIARKATIPRATVYGFLDTLLRERLISSITKGKRRYYLAEDPAKIKAILERKQQKIAKFLPQLQQLYLRSTSRPVIRAYDGSRGIIQILADVLLNIPTGGTYDVIISPRDEFAVLGDDFDRYVTRRIEKKIDIRVITERSDFTKGWDKVQNQKEMLRQVRFLPRGQHFSVSYHIYGHKVSMFSLQGPITGVIIENKEIADMERLQFEYMWRALK